MRWQKHKRPSSVELSPQIDWPGKHVSVPTIGIPTGHVGWGTVVVEVDVLRRS